MEPSPHSHPLAPSVQQAPSLASRIASYVKQKTAESESSSTYYYNGYGVMQSRDYGNREVEHHTRYGQSVRRQEEILTLMPQEEQSEHLCPVDLTPADWKPTHNPQPRTPYMNLNQDYYASGEGAHSCDVADACNQVRGQKARELIAMFQTPQTGIWDKKLATPRRYKVPNWGTGRSVNDEQKRLQRRDEELQLVITKPAFKMSPSACVNASLGLACMAVNSDLNKRCDEHLKSLPSLIGRDTIGKGPARRPRNAGIPPLNLPVGLESDPESSLLAEDGTLRNTSTSPWQRSSTDNLIVPSVTQMPDDSPWTVPFKRNEQRSPHTLIEPRPDNRSLRNTAMKDRQNAQQSFTETSISSLPNNTSTNDTTLNHEQNVHPSFTELSVSQQAKETALNVTAGDLQQNPQQSFAEARRDIEAYNRFFNDTTKELQLDAQQSFDEARATREADTTSFKDITKGIQLNAQQALAEDYKRSVNDTNNNLQLNPKQSLAEASTTREADTSSFKNITKDLQQSAQQSSAEANASGEADNRSLNNTTRNPLLELPQPNSEPNVPRHIDDKSLHHRQNAPQSVIEACVSIHAEDRSSRQTNLRPEQDHNTMSLQGPLSVLDEASPSRLPEESFSRNPTRTQSPDKVRDTNDISNESYLTRPLLAKSSSIDNTKILAEDYVQRLLKVKLPESTPRMTVKDFVQDTTIKMLYSARTSLMSAEELWKKRSTNPVSSTSDVIETHVSTSTRGTSDAASSAPCCPRELLTVIDHLTHHNQQLKAEMEEREKEKQLGRERQLHELEKLQKCVSKIKKSNQTKTPTTSHKACQTETQPKNVRNVRTQTEEVEIQQLFPITVVQLFKDTREDGDHYDNVDQHESDDVEKLNGETRSCKEEHQSRTDAIVRSGSEERDGLLSVTSYSRTESKVTQTELGERGFADNEVPPQWLLAEALAARRQNDPLQEEMKPAMTESKSIQVDTIHLKRKEHAIKLQDEAISVLMKKLQEVENEYNEKVDFFKRKLVRERRHHEQVREHLEQKIVNICGIVLDTYGTLPDKVVGLRTAVSGCVEEEDEDQDGEDDDQDKEDDDQVKDEEQEVTPSKVRLAMSCSRVSDVDVMAMKNYIRTLLRKLEKVNTNYSHAKHCLNEQQKDLKLSHHTQTVLETCVSKMKTKVEQLNAQLAINNQKAVTTTTGGKNDPEDAASKEKGGKQSQNVKTCFLQGRLRDVNQQLLTKNKLIQDLRQQLDDSQKAMRGLRGKMTRTESSNQNKMFMLENYKRQILDQENKLAESVEHNNILTSEVRGLRESATSMRKQISQLENELSERNARVDEWTKAKRRMEAKVGELLELLKVKTMEAKELERETQSKIKKALVYYNVHIAKADQNVREVGKRAKNFSNALESFLWCVERRRVAEAPPGDGNTTAAPAEARTLACSILNLTPAQLDSMITGDSDAAREHERSILLQEFKRIVEDEDFSETLSHFLLQLYQK